MKQETLASSFKAARFKEATSAEQKKFESCHLTSEVISGDQYAS